MEIQVVLVILLRKYSNIKSSFLKTGMEAVVCSKRNFAGSRIKKGLGNRVEDHRLSTFNAVENAEG